MDRILLHPRGEPVPVYYENKPQGTLQQTQEGLPIYVQHSDLGSYIEFEGLHLSAIDNTNKKTTVSLREASKSIEYRLLVRENEVNELKLHSGRKENGLHVRDHFNYEYRRIRWWREFFDGNYFVTVRGNIDDHPQCYKLSMGSTSDRAKSAPTPSVALLEKFAVYADALGVSRCAIANTHRLGFPEVDITQFLPERLDIPRFGSEAAVLKVLRPKLPDLIPFVKDSRQEGFFERIFPDVPR